MAMKRCPVCGEKYSDTYKYCPFCEEEEALRSGDAPRRRGGHRVVQSGPSLLSPILIVLILLMVCVLVYLLFGSTIASKLGFNKAENIPAASISEPAASSGSSAASSGAASSGAASSSANSSEAGSGVLTDEEVAALPETLTLSSKDFTMSVGESPVKLTVSGGSGEYSWSSSDDGIASVGADGSVTAISSGMVTITANNGTARGTCIVRVKGTGTANTGTTSGNATLSTTDASIKVGESFTLSVSGATSAVSYAAENSSIATVTDGGKVTGVASGRTNIVVKVDGKTLTCIVRVK